MRKDTKAHRFLSALVVATLVVGAGLPLARYACGITGTASPPVAMAAMGTLPADPCQGDVNCQNTSSGFPTSPTPGQTPNSAEATCCTLSETISTVPAVVASETTRLRAALAASAPAVADAPPLDPALYSLLARRARGATPRSARIPTRLRTSTFLL